MYTNRVREMVNFSRYVMVCSSTNIYLVGGSR